MQFLLLLFEGKIKTIIIAITISYSNSNNNIFFTITNCYYVSLQVIHFLQQLNRNRAVNGSVHVSVAPLPNRAQVEVK